MKENKAKKIILILLALICAAVLVYSLYQGLIIYIPQKQEQHRFSELQQVVEQDNKEQNTGSESVTEVENSSMTAKDDESRSNYSGIEVINNDFAGWLRISDTIIDYPVVKPPETDPEYYLHRDFDKNYSFSGTPFIGAGADENSDAFVIFAHKMNNGSMFGTLDNYADAEWAKQHADIEFDTDDEHRVYRVFAAVRTDVGGENDFKYYEKTGKLSDNEYNALVKELSGISVIDIGENPGGNITLEGCAFIGSLLGADTNNCGGFVGWRTKQITISDSIFAPESVTVSGTGSAVFARSTASVNNSYYFYALGEDSDNQGKQGYSVTAGENVTLALSGEETQYKVSGITACKNNSSLQYNGTCYAGEEDEVSLTLSHPDTPEGYIFSGYKASAGALNEGVLTMPAENVTISGGFEFADGVGTRLVGRSISVEGDVGVNFYMELDPEIAASETAYIQFTIPTGDKTETETIPVSEAERKDGCYVFKCDVAAKEMTSNIKAQIIDPESGKSGAVYTYSVKEYADALLSHTEGNWKYTKVAPLVKAMLNYGTAAQRYFDRNPDKLANADLSDEDRMLGEITNQLDAWENYTEDNLSDTTFDGATLSLKSQTSLSLYFTDQEELTFSCVDEKGTERTVETVRNGDTKIARIRDIAAAELQYNFTVSVKKGETELGSVTYSPMNYCYKALHSGTQDEKLQNVVKALYWYSQETYD